MIALDLGGLQPLEVVRAEIAVGLPVAQHMLENHQDTMRDGNHRLLFAPPTGNAVELGGEISILGMTNRPRYLASDRSQIGVAAGGLSAEALASTLFVAVTDPGPGGRCLALAKRLISVPNSARMAVAAVSSRPRQCPGQRHRLSKRGQVPFNLGLQVGDRLLERVDVGQQVLRA